MKTPVVAGNFDQYQNFLRQYYLSDSDYFLVGDYSALLGISRDVPLILYGTYTERPDWSMLESVVKTFCNAIIWDYDQPPEPDIPDQMLELVEWQLQELMDKYPEMQDLPPKTTMTATEMAMMKQEAEKHQKEFELALEKYRLETELQPPLLPKHAGIIPDMENFS